MTSNNNNQTLTYSVVVRDPNSWSASTGIHQLLRDCGHNHKTLATAARCYAKLTKQYPDGMYSAAWYHAIVEDSTGEHYDNFEMEQALGK